MVLKKHPYADSKVRLVRTQSIPGNGITVEEYVSYPFTHFRFFRIVTSKKLTQKLPKKIRGHNIWWLDVGGQFIEDSDLLTSVPITLDEYEQRFTKGIKGYLVANEQLTSILDHYSRLPDRSKYDTTDFFLKIRRK